MSMNCHRQSERDLAKFCLLLGSVGKKEKPECPCAGKICPSLPGALQGELWEFVQLNSWVSIGSHRLFVNLWMTKLRKDGETTC